MAVTKKETVRVMIITKDHRIEGDMHILEGSRLIDSLNSRAKDFYAMTGAAIFNVSDGTPIGSAPFIAVARDSIVAIFPMEE